LLLQVAGGDDDCISSSRCGLQSTLQTTREEGSLAIFPATSFFLESFLLQVPSLKIKKIKSCKARQGQIHEIKIGAGCEDEVIFYLEPMVDFRCKSMGVYFPFLPPFSFLLSSSLPRFHHSWLKIVRGLRGLSSHARSASASSLSHSSSMVSKN